MYNTKSKYSVVCLASIYLKTSPYDNTLFEQVFKNVHIKVCELIESSLVAFYSLLKVNVK